MTAGGLTSPLAFICDAARYGIELMGWDADWTGARVFIAGLRAERCRSIGPLEGLG